MPIRDYPPMPAPLASGEEDAGAEPLDASTLRARLLAREIANERFRRLKEKLLAARDPGKDP